MARQINTAMLMERTQTQLDLVLTLKMEILLQAGSMHTQKVLTPLQAEKTAMPKAVRTRPAEEGHTQKAIPIML